MIKTFQNKDLRSSPEIKIEDKEEDYFFPDIGGKQITVKAASQAEAEKKANSLIK
jgi:hypothetical protein